MITLLSNDNTTATVDSVVLKVSQVIDYRVADKTYKGKINRFWMVDKADWKSVWFSITSIPEGTDSVISLKNWKEIYDKGQFNKVSESFMQTNEFSGNIDNFI